MHGVMYLSLHGFSSTHYSTILSRTHALYSTHNNCSSSHTDKKDFFEIIKLLQDEKAMCYGIGTRLNLPESLLNTSRVRTRGGYAEAMNKIINNWLQRNYDTKKYGPPTWKMLADAVRAPNGGNNPTLADEIARLHPAKG